MLTREEIIIRDPFILPFDGRYLMTGTCPAPGDHPVILGYVTDDLERFEEPVCLFDPPEGFWGTCDFWAPEIHEHQGKFFMAVSFRSDRRRRGTQLLLSDNPLGPYRPYGEGPYTPAKWHCLDGTLYWDRTGAPYMVYVREWVQMVDGEMYAQRLNDDLTALTGEPMKLFSATWAPWCVTNDEGGKPFDTPGGYITDGPFLFRLPSGRLGMLWSSFARSGYVQAVCYSRSGEVTGPWEQVDKPLYEHDSGHGMLFETYKGQKMLSLHNLNCGDASHAVFLPVGVRDDALVVLPISNPTEAAK